MYQILLESLLNVMPRFYQLTFICLFLQNAPERNVRFIREAVLKPPSIVVLFQILIIWIYKLAADIPDERFETILQQVLSVLIQHGM